MSAPFPAQWIRGAGCRSPVPHPHLQAGPGASPRGGPAAPTLSWLPSSPPSGPFQGECPPTPHRHTSELVHPSLRRNPNTPRPRAPQIWRKEGQRERRQKHRPEPARTPPQGPGGRPCHGSLSRPQGGQGQHWALWLLRSRTAPGPLARGEKGMADRTGQGRG